MTTTTLDEVLATPDLLRLQANKETRAKMLRLQQDIAIYVESDPDLARNEIRTIQTDGNAETRTVVI
ncbi:MAG: hypothetical protein AAGA90_07975 [Actinomycetota bacterium]